MVFTTDNSGTVMALNNNRTKYEPAFDLMEEISEIERETGIDLVSRWSDRGRNVVADEVSCQRSKPTAWAAHCAVHGGDPTLVSGMSTLTYGVAAHIIDACRRVQLAARRLGICPRSHTAPA